MAYAILRDHAAAEDITQDVFTSLWSRGGTFDATRGVFRHWFLHLAHNRIVDELRRRKRVNAHDEGKEPDDPSLGVEAPGDPADEAVDRVLMGSVRRALRSLPADQRTVLELAYFHGATQVEIAQKTGAPLGTVKTRLRLGLMKLRHALAEPASPP